MIRLLVLLLLTGLQASSQERVLPGIHSHNDYEQAEPFWGAWRSGVESMEADIFLDKGELIVAHDTLQLKKRLRLDSLYLIPLSNCIQANNGTVYANDELRLHLMIDIKTATRPAMLALAEVFSRYPGLTKNVSLRIIITGNRPPPSEFGEWPGWMFFDGDINTAYTAAQLKRVAFFSANFRAYSSWRGAGELPAADKDRLTAAVVHATEKGSGIRFWNAPDNPDAWVQLIRIGVVLMNTDQPAILKQFLKQAR